MIVLAIMLAQGATHESTAQEIAACSDPGADQPERFCLADRKHERAERALAAALVGARRAAAEQQRAIGRFSRDVGGVTLSGDVLRALDASQRAWDRSYRADCRLSGLAVATGNAGTEGVTADRECEADRMLDRAAFLTGVF